jgi:hypothetical protein
MFEFSNRRFLVVGSDLGSRGCLFWNCPEPITNNCAHQVSKVVYNKSAETGLQLAQPSLSLCKLLPLQSLRLTSSCKDRAVAKYCHMELSVWRPNQRELACSWPSHHYLCENYSPCKPAKFEAHQFLQGQSCCKILSYGVKRMELSRWLLTSSFVCHALFPCFTLTKLPAFFLLLSEHDDRPGLLCCWQPQVKLYGRGPSSFVCHALFLCFTLTKLPAFFLLFSEHNDRPGLLSCWQAQVKLIGRWSNSFVCHALFPCFTPTKVP